MSAPRRQGAVLEPEPEPNHRKTAENLLDVAADERYREFLGQTHEISQLFDYYLPESRLWRSHDEQVVFVVEKLQTNTAFAATVENFTHQAGLPENKEAFRNAEYYL